MEKDETCSHGGRGLVVTTAKNGDRMRQGEPARHHGAGINHLVKELPR
jgi:hypothetical protein